MTRARAALSIPTSVGMVVLAAFLSAVLTAGIALGAFALKGGVGSAVNTERICAVEKAQTKHETECREQIRETLDRVKNIERILMDRREAKR